MKWTIRIFFSVCFCLTAGIANSQETRSNDDETIKLLLERMDALLVKNTNLERDLTAARARVTNLESTMVGKPWPIIAVGTCPPGRTFIEALCNGAPIAAVGSQYLCDYYFRKDPAKVLCE